MSSLQYYSLVTGKLYLTLDDVKPDYPNISFAAVGDMPELGLYEVQLSSINIEPKSGFLIVPDTPVFDRTDMRYHQAWKYQEI
jgi:hypothetical protein